MCCGGDDSKNNNSGGANSNNGGNNNNSSGGGGCCSCAGGGKGEKLQKWKQKKAELIDFKFKDVDTPKFREISFTSIRKYITMLIATLNYLVFLALDLDIIYWLFSADEILYPHAKNGGIGYAAITGLNWIWIGFNIYRAVKIYKSDDISDAFQHSETYRYRTIISYDVFCFFNALTAKRTMRDKMVLFIVDSLYQLPQIIAIKAPQLAIMMYNNDALATFATKQNGIARSQAAADAKFGFLVAEMFFRVFAVFVLYPWVRCCMNRDSLPEYANYLVESRVNVLIKDAKADLNAEDEEEGGGCCGK